MTLPKLSARAVTMTSATLLTFACSALHAEETAPNDLLNATLWMQNSVEYKANVQGMFALAKIRFDEALANKDSTALPELQKSGYQSLPPAVIVDCDETILDNNVYEAYLVKYNTSYSSKTWSQYVQDKVTEAMPGAVEFANYVTSKGAKIFYVTNRKHKDEAATFDNMQALGFPMDSKVDTLMTKGEQQDWGSNKTSRDQVVANQYRVVLMVGDNLGDFTDPSGSPEQRLKTYQANSKHWGSDWIMMPNPEYGSFESAAFGGNWSLSGEERRAQKISALKVWQPK